MAYSEQAKSGAIEDTSHKTRLREFGATGLYDGSLEVTGKLQVDRFTEMRATSTPVTPPLNHSRTYLNKNGTDQYCTIFHDGNIFCLGSSTGSIVGLGLTATAPIYYSTSTGNISLGSVNLSTGTDGPYIATITGTSHQVNVSSSGTHADNPVLSTPQNIDLTSNVSFGSVQVGTGGVLSGNYALVSVEPQNLFAGLENNSVFDHIPAFSVSIWIKSTSALGSARFIASKGPPGGTNSWYIQAVPNTNTISLGINGGTYQKNGTANFFDGIYHNVIICYDSVAGTTGFLDGVGISFPGGNAGIPPSVASPAGLWAQSQFALAGSYFDLRLFNVVLTTADAVSITAGNNPELANLVAEFPFTEGSGTTFADSSGNGHSLSLSGSVGFSSGTTPNVFSSTSAAGSVYWLNASASSVTVTVPTSLTSYTLKWPSAQGRVNSLMQNDGTGNLSFVSSNTIRGFVSATDPVIFNSTSGIISLAPISISTAITGNTFSNTPSSYTFLGNLNIVGNETLHGQTFTTVVTTATGTSNQVNVSASNGSVTFSTPQDIANASSPQFQNITLLHSGANSDTLSFQPNSHQLQIQAGSDGSLVASDPNASYEIWFYNPLVNRLDIRGANGLNTLYQVSVGSFTGAGLTTCGDAAHALAWSSTNNLFSCQALSGGGGSGGYAVEPATVTFKLNFGVTATTVTVSSNTILSGATFYATGGGIKLSTPVIVGVSSTNASGYLVGTIIQSSQTIFGGSTVTSTVYVGVVGSTITITPKSATSLIRISGTILVGSQTSSERCTITVARNSVDLSAGGGFATVQISVAGLTTDLLQASIGTYYDAPKTTSPLTYSVWGKTAASNNCFMGNFTGSNINALVVEEIAQ